MIQYQRFMVKQWLAVISPYNWSWFASIKALWSIIHLQRLTILSHKKPFSQTVRHYQPSQSIIDWAFINHHWPPFCPITSHYSRESSAIMIYYQPCQRHILTINQPHLHPSIHLNRPGLGPARLKGTHPVTPPSPAPPAPAAPSPAAAATRLRLLRAVGRAAAHPSPGAWRWGEARPHVVEL